MVLVVAVLVIVVVLVIAIVNPQAPGEKLFHHFPYRGNF